MKLLALLLISASLQAGSFSTLQGVVSIIANAPAAYEAVVHPKRTAQKIGGSVKTVAKKLKKGKKTT
jgi:hypothetical protein